MVSSIRGCTRKYADYCINKYTFVYVIQDLSFVSVLFNSFASLYLFPLTLLVSCCFLNAGCCIGICLHEVCTICTSFREGFPFRPEIWICKAVLYTNSWRQCHTHFTPGEHDKCKPPRKGFPFEGGWSFSFFLKASSSA